MHAHRYFILPKAVKQIILVTITLCFDKPRFNRNFLNWCSWGWQQVLRSLVSVADWFFICQEDLSSLKTVRIQSEAGSCPAWTECCRKWGERFKRSHVSFMGQYDQTLYEGENCNAAGPSIQIGYKPEFLVVFSVHQHYRHFTAPLWLPTLSTVYNSVYFLLKTVQWHSSSLLKEQFHVSGGWRELLFLEDCY